MMAVEPDSRKSSSWRQRGLLFAAVVAAGLMVRLNPLPAVLALWDDEAFTYLVILRPFPSGVLDATARDVHPPLYYLLLALWTRVAGTGALALRLPSIVFGVLSVGLAWWFGRLWHGHADAGLGSAATSRPARTMPVLLAAFVALGAPMVGVSYLARMYALLCLLTLTLVMLTILCLDDPKRRWPWAAFVATAVGVCYTHNYGLFLTFSLLVWLLLEGVLRDTLRGVVVVRALLAGLAIALCYSPWLVVLQRQVGEVSSNYWISPLRLRSALAPAIQVFSLPKNQPSSSLTFALLGGAVMLAAVWPWRRGSIHRLAGTVFLTHAILLVVAAACLGRSVFVARYVVHLLPVFLAPICYWIARIRDGLVLTLTSCWFVGLCVTTTAATLPEVLPDDDPFPDLVRRLREEHVSRNDVLLASNPTIYAKLRYYLDHDPENAARRMTMLALPTGVGHVPLGSAVPDNDRTRLEDLQSIVGRMVWVVHSGSDSLPKSLASRRRIYLGNPNRIGSFSLVLSHCEVVRGEERDFSWPTSRNEEATTPRLRCSFTDAQPGF